MRRLFSVLCMLLFALPAMASDFRSVAVPAAVLYDAPSQKAKRLYLIRAQTPVEIVVRLEGWFKVRDAEGTLAWIEAGQLAERRTVMVLAERTELRQADRDDAPVLVGMEKWLVVDYLAPAAPGWVKVQHRDGITGFVRSTQVWGA